MMFLVEHAPHVALELTLGVCLKLFCDNGRIHWRDLVNDLFFWVPGVQARPGDGLGRQIEDMHLAPLADAVAVPVRVEVEPALPLAAK